MRDKRSSERKNKNYQLFIAVISLFILYTTIFIPHSSVYANQVTLEWDESDGASGYKIYSGIASNSYKWVIDVGNVTTYTTMDLTDGYTYYFAATAYDSSSLESDYSDEISYGANTIPCSYSISPSSASFESTGGTGTIAVKTQSGCPWTAATGVAWVTITSGNSGSGSGIITYSVSSNTNSASRTAVSSTIAGQAFTFSQNGTQTTYTITASAGSGGTISPSGSVSVTSGSSQAFTMTAKSGYRVKKVIVDGISVGKVSYYTFSNVRTNHTIKVIFGR